VFTGDNLRAFQFLSADLLAPFAMCPPLAGSDYYGASAPPDGPQSATDLPTTGPDARWEGRPWMVPTFTPESIDEGGAHLDPDSIATATPRTFTVASPPDRQAGFGVDPAPHQAAQGHALHTDPDLPGSSRHWTYRASDSGSSRTPSRHCLPDPDRLTVPTRPVRCRGCSHPHLRSHARAAPSFTSQPRRASGGVISPPLDSTAPRGARTASNSPRSPPSPPS